MVTIQQCLISGRFLTTMGHFIALLILFSTIENNVQVSLGDDYTSSAKDYATSTSWVTIDYYIIYT